MSDERLIVGAGSGGGKGGGGGSAYVPVEAPDSLRSKAFAQVVDLLCEGEIEGLVDGLKSVYLDETPIQNADGSSNFTGVTLVTRNGSQDQAYIPGFSAAEAETGVGVEVKASASVTRTINNANADAVRVRISVPALTYQNPSNGDLSGTSVTYQIHLQTAGGGFVPQLVGFAYNSTGTQVVSSTQARITTSGYGVRAVFGFQVGGNATGTLAVEYKPVASGTWTTMGTISITGGFCHLGSISPGFPNRTSLSSGFLGTVSFGGFACAGIAAGGPVNGSVTIGTPALPLGTYDLRVVPTNLTVSGCSGVQRLIGDPNATISGKTTSRYERVHRIPLSGNGPWDVRVVRITADSASATLNNKTFWESYTEIIESKLRYPNTAIVGVKIDSSQFQRVPNRGYDCKLLKIRIPTNATVRADGSLSYSGSWDGSFQVAWSSCPAWCFYDLLTSERYGCGRDIPVELVDKWAIYSISQYCNALVPNGFGGTEPRFSCNIYIQNREEAYKVLQDMASIFRGMSYWSAGLVTAVQDAPSDPVMLYTPANVIEGQFTYQGSSLKTRHTVAIVSWNDPSDMYRAKQEYVENAAAIAKYGVISTDVVAVGCTSRGQANRVGRWLLYSEQLETETVTFRCGMDSALVRPGQIVQVADPVRAGKRMGGRVASASTTSVTVDVLPTFTLPATLWVMLPNGSTESRPVQGLNGNIVTVSSAFSAAPAAQSVWMLETTALEPQLFRVMSVAETDGSQYEVTALAHNPGKYGFIENNLTLEQRSITALNVVPTAPTTLTLSETLYRYQATVRSKINASWLGVDGVNRYRVDWNRDGGNFTSVTTQNTDYELLDTTPGTYIVRVYSLGANGKPSGTYIQQTINALGKTAPPADVTGFATVLDPDIGLTLTWSPVADLDLQGYEIRQGSTWATASFVALVSATSFKIGTIASGSTTYLIRALDTSGIYSANAASVTQSIAAAGAPTVSAAFAGPNVILTWNAVRGDLVTAGYEIRYGASFAAGVSLGTVQATTFTTKAAFSGTRQFWVAAVDIKGNVGAAGQVSATVQLPAAPTINAQVIDNNLLFRWNDVTATLPIDYYELRKGATYASAEVIGSKQGLFTSVFETASGTYTYWVTGVDAAGNYGTPGSISAQVSQPPDYVLKYNQNSTFAGTKTNILGTAAGQLLGVNTTETWTTHFTSRGWNTPQDQINAGYPVYAMPSTTTADYVETIDYGTVLGGTRVTATLTQQQLTGSTTVTPTISLSTNGTTWTDYAGLDTVFGAAFRYFRIRYDFSSTGGDDLMLLTGLNIRLDSKLKNDSGTGTANAADSGGTTVNFNVAFVDVESISVTPLTTSAVIAVYDFVDVLNPTSFKVLLFNTSGTRVSGNFSWSARGV